MGRMSMLSVLLAACLLALGVASCGGGADSSSTASSVATQGQESGTTGGTTAAKPAGEKNTGKSGAKHGGGSGETESSSAKPHHDSGGGATQFRVKGGDNSIQEYGAEAGGSELDEASSALHGFLDARAARDWEKACTYVAASVTGSLQELAGKGKGNGCGAILGALSRGIPQSALEEAAEADVGAMRVEGDRSFLLYRGARNTNFAIPMTKEGNAWKVAALAGTPLS
jgi:hypothetical protein